MRLLRLIVLAGLGCCPAVGCSARADESAPPPTASERQANTEPSIASDPATGSESDADRWLSRLESLAADITTLESVVRMTSRVDLLDEVTVRFGRLHYAADDPPQPVRFAVRFDKLRVDDVIEPIDQAYVFDGRWLLDLDAQDRQATRRELVPADGDAAEVMAQGPFPLPLNLQRDRVLQRFEVTLAPPADGDPEPYRPVEGPDAGTAPPQAAEPAVLHLVLTPRPGIDFDGQRLDLWFDTATALPLRSVTLQEDGDTTQIDFFRLTPHADLPDGVFDTAFPEGDWERQTLTID